MAVMLGQVFNASEVIAESAKYSAMPTNPLRLFAANMSCGHGKVCHFQVDQTRLSKCTRPPCFTTGPNAGWTPTTPDAISSDGKGNAKAVWTGSFSAVCYLFGRRVQAARNYPVGLISSFIGGTPDECWSSKEALATCPLSPHSKAHMDWGDCWYSMITPLLRAPIFGAIWVRLLLASVCCRRCCPLCTDHGRLVLQYQGETDTTSGGSAAGAVRAANYNCTLKAMIKDWRKNFHAWSQGATSRDFPFGVVQLAPWSDKKNDANDGCGQDSAKCQVATVRWAETQVVRELPNVFEAITLDLGDFSSPFGSIHPRHKIPVGDRLAFGAEAVAYNSSSSYWTGPNEPLAWLPNTPGGGLRVRFSNCSDGGVELRELSGFETRVGGKWTAVKALRNAATQALCSVDLEPASFGATELRYNWFRVACYANETKDGTGTGRCAIYSGGQVAPCAYAVSSYGHESTGCPPNMQKPVALPAGPFLIDVSAAAPPVRVCGTDASNPTYHTPGLPEDVCRDFCAGQCVLPGPEFPHTIRNAGKVQLLNLTRITPREIDTPENKDFGDLPADYSFMLMQKSFSKSCEHDAGGYMCANGTGRFLKPNSPDQVFMTWEMKVDGNFGPYSKCNPKLDKFPNYNGFQCAVWNWDKECRKNNGTRSECVMPAVTCGNCSRNWNTVGWESRAKHHPGPASFGDLLGGNWFNLNGVSECKGSREPGDGLAPVCAWKVSRLVTVRNATCVMGRVTATARLNATAAPCFQRCATAPLKQNETLADCDLNCVLGWAGRATRPQLLAPFDASFLPAAQGGCPELPPLPR